VPGPCCHFDARLVESFAVHLELPSRSSAFPEFFPPKKKLLFSSGVFFPPFLCACADTRRAFQRVRQGFSDRGCGSIAIWLDPPDRIQCSFYFLYTDLFPVSTVSYFPSSPTRKFANFFPFLIFSILRSFCPNSRLPDLAFWSQARLPQGIAFLSSQFP